MTARDYEESLEAYKAHDEIFRLFMPELVAARQDYFRSPSQASEAALKTAQNRATELLDELKQLRASLMAAAGLTEEELVELAAADRAPIGDREDRTARSSLTIDRLSPTASIDSMLPGALAKLEALVPSEFLAAQADVPHGMEDLISGRQPLSLVGGVRPASETTVLHRLRQMLRVARDFIERRPTYDHFAGALLVPQVAQLGSQLNAIAHVGGDWLGRLERLWRDPSDKVDSTVFELLVAGALVTKGRRVEFVEEELAKKTPDIRCWDPYPLQIECKRKRALGKHDFEEEARMREVFELLKTEAMALDVSGRFSLRLVEESKSIDVSQVAQALFSQRLSAQPERPTHYSWGSVAFRPLPTRVRFGEVIRLYSPRMLKLFGWNSDLPEWDGLICEVDGNGEAFMDRISRPLAMVWTNEAPQAIHRRAWSAVGLIGDAVQQFTKGDHGMIYLAYQESARAEIADLRLDNLMKRAREFQHERSIRVPMVLVTRLYPRVLGSGLPDLIESSVRLVSEVYGDPATFRHFPQRIFSPEADNGERYPRPLRH